MKFWFNRLRIVMPWKSLKLCLDFFFHPSGVFIPLLLYTALSCRLGAVVIPLPTARDVLSDSGCSVMHQPTGSPSRHLVLLPRRRVVLVLLLC